MSFLNRHSYLVAALALLAAALWALRPDREPAGWLAVAALLALLAAVWWVLRPRPSAQEVRCGDGAPTGLFLYSRY